MTDLTSHPAPAPRVPSDTNALLFEAARLWRARSHYGPGDGRLNGLFQRAFQLWRADLDRHGSFELLVEPTGLRAGGAEKGPRLGGLSGLHRALTDRGAEELHFQQDLEAESFAAIFEVLVLDREIVEREGGFAWAVYRRAPAGLIVNGVTSTDTPPPILAEALPVVPERNDAIPSAVPDTLPELASLSTRATPEPVTPFVSDAPSFSDFSDDSVSETLLPRAQPVRTAPAASLSQDEPTTPWDNVPNHALGSDAPSVTSADDDSALDLLPRSEHLEMADGHLPTDDSLDALFDTLPDFDAAPESSAIEELATQPDDDDSDENVPPEGEPALAMDAAVPDYSEDTEPLVSEDDPDEAPLAIAADPAEVRVPTGGDADEAPIPRVENPRVEENGNEVPVAVVDAEGNPSPVSVTTTPPTADPADEGLFAGASTDIDPADLEGSPSDVTPFDLETADAKRPEDPAAPVEVAGVEAGADEIEAELELERGPEIDPSRDPIELDPGIGPADIDPSATDGAPFSQAPSSLELEAPDGPLPQSFDERLAALEAADEAAYRAELEAVLYGLSNEGPEEKDALALVLSRHVREARDGLGGEDALRGLSSLADIDSVDRWLHNAIDDGGDPEGTWGGVLTLLAERAAPALLIELGKERELEARRSAGRLLAGMGESARAILAKRLNQDDPASLLSVTRLIRELGLPAPVKGLAKLLEHEQTVIREEAAQALATLGDAESLNALRGALLHGQPDLQQKAAVALGRCDATDVTETLCQALTKCLESDSGEVAREIIFSLGKRRDESAAPVLADILQRKKRFGGRKLRELKLAAAGALAKIPGEEAAAALTQLAQVRDNQLRRAAELSLSRRESWLTSGEDGEDEQA